MVLVDRMDTGLQILHTPGHTPDELALWDEGEKMLYVGDTVYEWEPIIFPLQGDIGVWLDSMKFLSNFVEEKGGKVWINSGHDTSMGDAKDVLLTGRRFIERVLAGKVPIKERKELHGVVTVSYAAGDGRFSLRCPEGLLDQARRKVNTHT